MEITVKRDVFGDPEFCNLSVSKNGCRMLEDMHTCNLFLNKHENPENLKTTDYPFRTIKCDQCKEAYQIGLKEKEILEEKQPAELNLKKELKSFMKETLDPDQKPFHVFMSEQYPDIEYLCMFIDKKGIQKYPDMQVLKGYHKDIISDLKSDMKSIYGIEVIEVEKLIGQECHFECEKFGLPKDSLLNNGCKKCIHIPPF